MPKNNAFEKYLGEDGVYMHMARLLMDGAKTLLEMAEDAKLHNENGVESGRKYMTSLYTRINIYAAEIDVLNIEADKMEDILIDEITNVMFVNDSRLIELFRDAPPFARTTLFSMFKAYVRDSFKKEIRKKEQRKMYERDIDDIFSGFSSPYKNNSKARIDYDALIDQYIKEKKEREKSKDNNDSDAENS